MFRKVVGLGCLLMVVSACGDNGGVAETTAPAATVTSTSVADMPEDGIVPVAAAPCDLLTADEVAAATGLAVAEVRDEPPIDCVFDLGADAGVDVFVGIEDGQGRFSGAANIFKEYMLIVADGDAETVADVGERAVYAPGYRALAVDAGGGRFITVGVSGGYGQLAEPRAVLISLAESVVDRLSSP
jgi:hypothetical protein